MSKKNYRYNKDVKWNLEDAMKFFQKPKGRIKRMRTKYVGSFVDYLTKPTSKKYADDFPRCFATITRWNRH